MKCCHILLFFLISTSYFLNEEAFSADSQMDQTIVTGDLTSALMLCTFKIQSGNSFGTAFILGEPIPGMKVKALYVLFTAKHVLEKFEKDTATLWLRKKENEKYLKFPYTIPIRDQDAPLWKSHPNVDISAMRVTLPSIGF